MYNFHESKDLDFLERTTIDEPTKDKDEEELDEDEEELDKDDSETDLDA